MERSAEIVYINGPVVKAEPMDYFTVREMVMVGSKRLIGEVVSLDKGIA